MSWSGFKKTVGRATTQVMMKTGQVEKTNDRDFETEHRRYRTMEASSLKLQKETKGWLDAVRALTASQCRIAETVDAFYGDAGTQDGISKSYKRAVEELDRETVKALDGPYRACVLDPINRFCAYFPDVNEAIKKRQNKLTDYDGLRAKVKRLTEKPDKDPAKLPLAEKEAQAGKLAYEGINNTLLEELPQLVDMRVPYLDPSFDSVVKLQMRLASEGYSHMAGVQEYLPKSTRDEYSEGKMDERVEEVLQEVRNLSICGSTI